MVVVVTLVVCCGHDCKCGQGLGSSLGHRHIRELKMYEDVDGNGGNT